MMPIIQLHAGTPLRKRYANMKQLFGVGAIMVLATIGTASAQTPTVTIYSYTSGANSTNTLPTSIPFSILSLGTSSLANSFVGATTLTPTTTPNLTAAQISSIAFGGGTLNGATNSGVYGGSVGGSAATPFGSSSSNKEYVVAGGPGNGTNGTVTVNYSVSQRSVNLLWGSIDSTASANIVTFKNSAGTTVATINGSQVFNDLSGAGGASGSSNVALRLSNIPAFTTIVFPDSYSPAFELALGVPEPASLALFGVAVLGIGFVRHRRRAA